LILFFAETSAATVTQKYKHLLKT